jgi:lysophospholipid acyltransferase (LPLAT)-like uncharacterized protein
MRSGKGRDLPAPPARALAGSAIALFVSALRRSCRVAWVDDPRPALRRAGRPYLFALLHAHQIAALVACDEPRLAAMLSRSRDGGLLAPSLRRVGVLAVRGSSRSAERDKGGLAALDALAAHLAAGDPALIAVDGPRGPRGRVHLGIAELALRCGAAVLPVLPLASRRLALRGSWDRLQIPLPGARIAVHCAAPLEPAPGERATALRDRIETALGELEASRDPGSAGGRTQPGAGGIPPGPSSRKG